MAWDGRIDPVQKGSVSITATGASGSAAVAFPHPFVNPPIVMAQVTGTATYFSTVASITVNGMTVGWAHRDGTSTTATLVVQWVAREP